MKRAGFIDVPDRPHYWLSARASRPASSATAPLGKPDFEGLVALRYRDQRRPHRQHRAARHGAGRRRRPQGRPGLAGLRRHPHPSRQGPYLAALAQPGRQLPGRRHRHLDATARRAGRRRTCRRRMEFGLQCAWAQGTVAVRTHHRFAGAAGRDLVAGLQGGARRLGRPRRCPGREHHGHGRLRRAAGRAACRHRRRCRRHPRRRDAPGRRRS